MSASILRGSWLTVGIKRIVDTSFWTDGKVDEFTPEDKYFMLYLLTNPFSTQLGIYEISIKQVAFQLGYSVDAVRALIERFENKYGMILFSPATNEIAIKNFLRHSIIKGGAPVRDCLIKEIKKVKNKDLIARVFLHIKDSDSLNETVKKIITEYEEKNGTLYYSNEKQNDNENENDNEVSYHDTGNESLEDKPKQPSKADIDGFFESVWELYPVKKGKGQVSDAKRKVLYNIGLEELQRAIDRYLAELKKDADWRKPQNGSTFFNSGYVDYLDKNFVPDQTKPGGRKEIVPSWCKKDRELDDDELAAIQRMMAEDAPTVGNNPDLADRAEKLKQRLGG
jgi:hypothetical protein